VFNIKINFVNPVWERYLHCYEVYTNQMAKAYFWGCDISNEPEVYQAEVEALRDSIRKSTKERPSSTRTRPFTSSRTPSVAHLEVGTLFLDKEELTPGDSVSEASGSGSFSVEKYMASYSVKAFRRDPQPSPSGPARPQSSRWLEIFATHASGLLLHTGSCNKTRSMATTPSVAPYATDSTINYRSSINGPPGRIDLTCWANTA
jgi:hypothetical protein